MVLKEDGLIGHPLVFYGSFAYIKAFSARTRSALVMLEQKYKLESNSQQCKVAQSTFAGRNCTKAALHSILSASVSSKTGKMTIFLAAVAQKRPYTLFYVQVRPKIIRSGADL